MKSSWSAGLLAIQMSLSGFAFAQGARPLPDAPEQAAASSESAVENIEKARGHFTRGVQFYNNGDYKLALIEFRRAHELSQNYRVLYNIGQVNHELGNYTKALAALEEYLRRGGPEVPEARRAEAASSIAVLRKKTARVSLTVDIGGAELILDDLPFGQLGRERTLTIDAGEHRLEVRKFGYRPFSKLLVLAAGDNAEVEVKLVKLPPLTPVAASGQQAPQTSPLIWAGWSATGVFAVGAAVTGVLALSNAKQLAELRDSPDSNTREREDTAKRARTFATVADVLAGAAVLTGGTALYFSLRGGSKKEEGPREPATRIGLNGLGVAIAHRY